MLASFLAPLLAGCNLVFRYQDREPDGGEVPGADGGRQPGRDGGGTTGDGGSGGGTLCKNAARSTWSVSLVAGTGAAGLLDGPAASAQLNQPRAVCAKDGSFFISDWGNGRVRWIYKGELKSPRDYKDNLITVNSPAGLRCRGWSSVEVAEAGAHRLRAIAMMTPLSTKWVARTIMGTGAAGDSDGKNPSFSGVMGLAYGWSGYYLVADTGNHRVRKVFKVLEMTPKGYPLASVKGGGPGFVDGAPNKSRFNQPTDVAWDATRQRVYIADRGNHRIRYYDKITDKVMTLAGTGKPGCVDGTVGQAQFNRPTTVSVASDGVVFVADTGSNAVRMIAGTSVVTIAGTGKAGATSPNQKTPGMLRGPYGVHAESPTRVHVADTGNHRIWTLER